MKKKMSVDLVDILKKVIAGFFAGAVLGILNFLNKKRKMLKNGVGIDVTHLQLDTYLFGLVKQLRVFHKKSMFSATEIFNSSTGILDTLVKELAELRRVSAPTIAAVHNMNSTLPGFMNNAKYLSICEEIRHASSKLIEASRTEI